MSASLHIVIAGAGIGGLTAALALARAGHRVSVLERAPAFEEIGAGLQLAPNATHILQNLGVLAHLHSAVQPEKLMIRRGRDALLLATLTLGAQALQRWGAPMLVVHRADLHGALLASVAQAGAAIELIAGTELTGCDDGPSAIFVHFQRDGSQHSLAADGLVGADGLNSTVRKKLFPGGEKRYSNRTAWRALVPAADAPECAQAERTNLWLGKDAHLVHYPVRDGALINLVAIVGDGFRAADQADFWAQPGDPRLLATRFADWHGDARALIAAAPVWRKWPLFDRAPLQRLGLGRVTLLGDAAHPMLPFLAQGSAQAIEDGAELGRALAGQGVVQAFTAYSAARTGRTARVQAQSRQQGQIYHLGGPAAFLRDSLLKSLSPEKLASRMDWLYGYRSDV